VSRADKQQQQTEKLRAYLRQCGIHPGDRLPGERELAASLGIGRMALRPALDALEAEGVVERRPQSGTFLTVVPVPSGRGATVAVIAPFQGNGIEARHTDAAWLHRVISAFERTVAPAGVRILLKDQSPRADDLLKDLAREAVAEGAQAVVLVHPSGPKAKIAHALTLLHDLGVSPLIVSPLAYPGLASQIYFDSTWGIYHGTRHLLMQGHRRIGFAGGPLGNEWVQERLTGYRQALESADILPDEAWIWLPDIGARPDASADGAIDFHCWRDLDAARRPTAVVAANDIVALGFLKAAGKAGFIIPDHLSLVGFDNDPGALAVGLTTIDRPTEALGEMVARVMLERLDAGTHADAITVRLRPVLIERRTVGPVAIQTVDGEI
jgi:DNA-binding LacI/PurR family transcriptional regulator